MFNLTSKRIFNSLIKYNSLIKCNKLKFINNSRYYCTSNSITSNLIEKEQLHYKSSSLSFKFSEKYLELSDLRYDDLRDVLDTIGAVDPDEILPANYYEAAYKDKVRIRVKAGDGGKGNVVFFRAKFIPLGPAVGGNGGNGADIIVRADQDDNNLAHLQGTYKGVNGDIGGDNKKTGKSGDTVIISVPPGTIIRKVININAPEEGDLIDKTDPRFNPKSPDFDVSLYMRALNSPYIDGEVKDKHNVHIGQSKNNGKGGKKKDDWQVDRVLADLKKFGDEYLIAKGGKGGKGNHNFSSSVNRSPDYAEDGEKGEAVDFELELKVLADFGLVGYPNAGKSTVLSVISNAIPKIRDYAFTTLNPYVGVIDFNSLNEIKSLNETKAPLNLSKRKRFSFSSKYDNLTATIADLPGIVEGAHLNIGLGLDFLKHIERTRALIYVVDMSNGGIPAFWDGKPVKVVKDKYKKIIEKSNIEAVKKNIKLNVNDENYRSPWGDYANLLQELESYQEGITSRPSIILANKMDKEYSEDHLKVFIEATSKITNGAPIIPISAHNNSNINEIKEKLSKFAIELKKEKLAEIEKYKNTPTKIRPRIRFDKDDEVEE